MIEFLDKYRAAKAIPDLEVKNFISELSLQSYLFSESAGKEFLPAYKEWIGKSELNRLRGFEQFSSLSYIHGTVQAFDAFYAAYKEKRFRCFRGEFVYHRLSWRKLCPHWKYLEDDDLREGDAVVMSVPFSDLGAKHPATEVVLDQCERKGIPVLLDLAYFNLCRDLSLDLGRECIDAVVFSLSKSFVGLDKARVGLRCKRSNIDDPIDVFNSMGMFNQMGAALGLKMIQKYSPDYNQLKYRDKQEKICAELQIQPSDCVIFGLGDERFSPINRGSKWNRVCLSEDLGSK